LERDAFELFQAHFNPAHELVQLTRKVDWDRFEAGFASGYTQDMGAPAKATRLMVGLQYLKYTFDESDESVVARWVENPYWQPFCGFTHLQHECPIHPSSLRAREGINFARASETLGVRNANTSGFADGRAALSLHGAGRFATLRSRLGPAATVPRCDRLRLPDDAISESFAGGAQPVRSQVIPQPTYAIRAGDKAPRGRVVQGRKVLDPPSRKTARRT